MQTQQKGWMPSNLKHPFPSEIRIENLSSRMLNGWPTPNRRSNCRACSIILNWSNRCHSSYYNLCSGILDQSPLAWRTICGITALVSLSSLFAQLRIPMNFEEFIPLQKNSLLHKIVNPWKEAFTF